MTESRYALSVNAGGKFVTATLTGNWTCETVDRFKNDLLLAGSRLIMAGVNGKAIGLLIDTRAFGPQAQEVVAYYAASFDEKRFHGARIAVLFHSTLQKMQVRRMAVGTPHFFEDLVEATGWLTGLD